MAKQIKATDIFESEDIFRGIRQSAEQAIDTLGKFKNELKQTADELKKTIGGASVGDTKSINELITATQKANQVKEQTVKIDQEQERLRKLSIQAEREELKLKKDLKTAADKEAKAKEKVARETAKQNSAYSQESARLNELRKRYKDLAVQNKENTAEARKLLNEIGALDTKLKRIDATVGQHQRNVGNYKSALGGLNNVLAAFGVGFGVSQVKNFIQESVKLSQIQEKAVAQVAAGLASTGGAVGYTLDELKAKASGFQKETLFGDEQILTDLTAVMLTFTNVTGDAFDRAQQSALDLSTRMGGDLKGAAVQLGKALNDPIKGVTALRKVGVSFTDEQQAQIKTLTESGKLYQAQTIILDEMNKEFAGSAKAAANADGGITQLQNAFGDAREELGKMVIEGLQPVIQGLKEFFSNLTTEDIRGFVHTLGTIATIIGKVILAWGAYKTVSLALQAIDKARMFSFKAFGQQMMAQIPMTKAYTQAQKESAAAAKASGQSAKAAGSAMSAVPWVAIAAVVVELGMAFWDAANGTKAFEAAQKKLDKTLEASTTFANERSQSRQDNLTKELARLQRLRNENKISESDFLKQKASTIAATREQIKADIQAVQARNQQRIEQIKQLEVEARYTGNVGETVGKIKSLRIEVMGANAKIAEYRKELDTTTESQKDATSEVNANSNAQDNNTKKTTKTIEKKKEEIKVNQDLLKSLENLRKEYQNQTFTDRALLAIEKERNTERLKAEYAVSTDADKDAQLKEALLLNEQEYQRKLTLLIESEDIVKAETKVNDLRLKMKGAKGLELIALTVQLKEAELNLLKEQEEKELLDAGKNEELKAKIRSEYALKRQQVEEDFALKSIEEENKTEDKRIEIQKMSAEQRNEWAKFATDYFIEQSNKRIAQLDKEIAAAEKQQDTLRELAANGNINAKESLAENQRIIDEANRKKAQEERRKQMIELVSGVYQTYNQKVAANAENPLMETIRDTVLLQQFANTLLGNMPTFFDGTEDTGKNGQGVDGKGGFHAILHPNERVVPKSLNEKIGSLSNEQLAKVAQEYQNGKLINGTQPMSAIDLSLLVNEMKDLKDVIRNKPETNIELGEITSSVMEIVKTTKQGNTLKTNRFRVRK